MRRSNAERPAIAKAMQRAAENDHLGRLISFDATSPIPNFQAQHLARRFGLAPHLAAVVAELCFGGVR